MILLDTTSKKLELLTGSAVSTDFSVSWVDHTTSGGTPGSNDGNASTATTTDLVTAPGASTQRQVKSVFIVNRGTTSQTVTVKFDNGGTERFITPTVTLASLESLAYEDGQGWFVLTTSGAKKAQDSTTTGYTGQAQYFYKVGTAPEAAGVFYSWAKDTGNPGAWSPGTPGLNGRATDGTTAADAGCILIKNPTVGANYLISSDRSGTVIHQAHLWDVLWVNTGLVVTTTTAQAIASPTALPARDINGSSNGEGVFAAILVTTATTNAAAITNTTISYTNSDGVAGRTATIASFPATAVIGTVVQFQLQAGDKGIRSIQSVTLGTSYAAGAISVILFRPINVQPVLVANVGGQNVPPANPGVRLYNGTCLLPFGLMSSTTAVTITGLVTVMER